MQRRTFVEALAQLNPVSKAVVDYAKGWRQMALWSSDPSID
jgi:hypothetical protein